MYPLRTVVCLSEDRPNISQLFGVVYSLLTLVGTERLLDPFRVFFTDMQHFVGDNKLTPRRRRTENRRVQKEVRKKTRRFTVCPTDKYFRKISTAI